MNERGVTRQRIQRRRTRGWRMPEGAVYVGRPTKWGNPYRIIPDGTSRGWIVRGNGVACSSDDPLHPFTRAEAAEWAADRFRRHLQPGSHRAYLARIELAGRDLACWCPLDQPCHADVLLEIANRRE